MPFADDELKKVVSNVAEVMNVGSRFFNKQGAVVLLGLIEPLKALVTVDFTELKNELGDLDESEMKDLKVTFVGKLALQNPLAQAKIVGASDVVGQAVALVEKGLSLYKEASSLLQTAKDLLK